MSPYLEELIEEAGSVEKLGKVIESLEAKLAKKAEEKKAEVVVAPKTKPEEETKNETVGPKQGKPSGGNWW